MNGSEITCSRCGLNRWEHDATTIGQLCQLAAEGHLLVDEMLEPFAPWLRRPLLAAVDAHIAARRGVKRGTAFVRRLWDTVRGRSPLSRVRGSRNGGVLREPIAANDLDLALAWESTRLAALALKHRGIDAWAEKAGTIAIGRGPAPTRISVELVRDMGIEEAARLIRRLRLVVDQPPSNRRAYGDSSDGGRR